MTAAARADRALLLAAVAAIGLVVTPLLHAEEHRREQSADTGQIADAWEAGSRTPLDALARALQHQHDGDTPEQPAPPPGHSHGPSAPGAHGQGTLAHLALALYAAPALPQLIAGAPDHLPPALPAAPCRAPQRYLISEWPQGPPPRVS
jgi:hypothetical protein